MIVDIGLGLCLCGELSGAFALGAEKKSAGVFSRTCGTVDFVIGSLFLG